jgi:hypothetical protein
VSANAVRGKTSVDSAAAYAQRSIRALFPQE